MMTYIDDLADLASAQSLKVDAETLSDQTITVSADVVDRARLISQTVRAPEQWQAYQNAIALFGLQQWLAERGIDIGEAVEASSVYDNAIAGLINGVCHLQIGRTKVCLIPISSLADEYVAIPRAALELEDYVPHLFIGVDVREELDQVTFWRGLQFDTLCSQLRQGQNLDTDTNWTYRVPQQWFHLDADTTLLYLRCLEIDNTLSPAIPAPQPARTVLEENLAVLRARTQSSQRPLWKLLPWNQAIALLQSPQLAMELLHPEASGSPINPKTNTAINVAQWLQGKLDDAAQALNWTLLPSFAPALRSIAFRQLSPPLEQLEGALTTLQSQGVDIPVQARSSYLDFSVAKQNLRLYVVAWDTSEEPEQPEWALLTVISAAPNQVLSHSVTLQIRDGQQLLDQQTLDRTTNDACVFSAVSGAWDEQFWIMVHADNGQTLTLPAFKFDPSIDDYSGATTFRSAGAGDSGRHFG